MALRVVLCDPRAESLVTLAEADAYLSRHPDGGSWEDLGDDEVGRARRERFVAAASRVVGRAPLSEGPLWQRTGWAESAFPIPLASHPVESMSASSANEQSVMLPALAGRSRDSVIGGAIKTDDGFFAIEDFASATGAATLGEALPSDWSGGACAFIAPLPRPIREAVCEQAIDLLLRPMSEAVEAASHGVTQWSVSGAGAGSASLRPSLATAELCFAARRLLRQAKCLRYTGRVRGERS